MKMKEGDKFTSNAFGRLVVIEIVTPSTSRVKFDSTGGTSVYRNSDIRAGKVKDYHAPTMYGVGVIVSRKLALKNKMGFKTWVQMIKRGYDKVWKESNPTYKDVTVESSWHKFPNFLKWYLKQITEDTYILDKDIMAKKELKQYNSKNAFMVPYDINMFYSVNTKAKESTPIGVHKVGKRFIVRINSFNKYFPSDKSSKGSYVGSYKNTRQATRVYEYYRASILSSLISPYKGKINKKLFRYIKSSTKRTIKKGLPEELKVNQDKGVI